MKNLNGCKVTLTGQDGGIHIEAEKITMEELAVFSGFLQHFLGCEAIRRGKNLDEAKDGLLDIYLATCDLLEKGGER